MYHGQGGKKDEVDIDAERFFRAVDRGVLEHHSRPSDLPLLLAALPENQSIFRRVSHNPFLVAEGVNIHPDALPIDALRDLAWRVVEPQYLARLTELVEKFEGARSKGLGADELVQLVEAVVRGALDRFSEQITRVEVHLSDENSDKKFGTDDKRCLLEARLADRSR